MAANAVKQRFSGRETEVDQLAEVFGCSAGQASPCLVCGPGATGKTTVVRHGCCSRHGSPPAPCTAHACKGPSPPAGATA